MKRFIEGEDRTQVALLPECLDDYVDTDNPVRVVEAFVEHLDLEQPGLKALSRWRPGGVLSKRLRSSSSVGQETSIPAMIWRA
jgi:hypothetical protein